MALTGDHVAGQAGSIADDNARDVLLAAHTADIATKTTAAAAVSASRLTRTAVKTGNYAAAPGDLIPADTTAGAFTITLPTGPADKTLIGVKTILPSPLVNAVTVACAGADVFNRAGGSTTRQLLTWNQSLLVQYDSATHVWTILYDSLSLDSLDLRYLTQASASSTFVLRDSVPVDIKPAGNSAAGIFDWDQNGSSGYIFHLHSGVSSANGTYLIGMGTDAGLGGGLLISHKNTVPGFRLIANPGSGVGEYTSGYSVNPVKNIEVYAGSGGVRLSVTSGQGCADGITTSGSTTLTSASAAFVAGDVGQVVWQVTSITTTSPAGTIPAATTIVSVTDATHAVMSAPAGQTSTALRFAVAGRIPVVGQPLIEARDTDGTTVLTSLQRGRTVLRSVVGQALSILSIYKDSNGTPILDVAASGQVSMKFAAAVQNAGLTGTDALSVTNFGTSAATVTVKRASAQTGNQLQIVDNSSAVQSRFDKDGYFITHKNTIPADAALNASDLAFWFDDTNGASKLMVKAKSADGTVRTATVALA